MRCIGQVSVWIVYVFVSGAHISQPSREDQNELLLPLFAFALRNEVLDFCSQRRDYCTVRSVHDEQPRAGLGWERELQWIQYTSIHS